MYKKLKDNWLLISVCLLGTMVRLLYAFIFAPWNQSPDQLAWETVLSDVTENGAFTYDHLIHYPHEGGSILVSLLALLFKPISPEHSLVFAGFVIDFTVRFIQLWVVRKLFPKPVFLLFAVWTVFSLPSILPWSSLVFGLHPISAVFPFILLYLLSRNQPPAKHLYIGIFLGLSIWFAYANLVLLAGYFVYALLSRRYFFRNIGYMLAGLCGILLIHVFVRYQVYAAFEFTEHGFLSVRGLDTSQNLIGPDVWQRLKNTLVKSLAGSSQLVAPEEKYTAAIRYVWLILTFFGLLLLAGKNRTHSRLIISGLSCVLVFFILYALSPYYFDEVDSIHFVLYRHFSFILPLLVCLTLTGMQKLLVGKALIPVYLMISIFGTLTVFTHLPSTIYRDMEAGWVIGNKYGHDPKQVVELIELRPDHSSRMAMGVGWNVATVFFEKSETISDEVIEHRITRVVDLVLSFPVRWRADILRGYDHAFHCCNEPKPDHAIYERIITLYEQRSEGSTPKPFHHPDR